MKDIQDWLGLSSYATTANIYAHLDTDFKKQPATKMNQTVSITSGISAAIQAGGENSGREPGFKKKILRFSIHEKPEYFQLVPVVGLEPTRCRHQRILSPSRLPIPSYRQRDCKILYTTLKRLASLFDGGKSENNRLFNIPFPVEMCYDNLDFITYPMEGFRR